MGVRGVEAREIERQTEINKEMEVETGLEREGHPGRQL